MDLSDTEINVEKEMFVEASKISREEEEQATQSFNRIIFENFAEDKSEDWLTHGSEATPDKDIEQDIFADIQDNKTDDDQPDLETDESSGERSKMKNDPSMEGFTEATDITTPIEMGQESAPSRKEDF